MAYNKIIFENPNTGAIKEAPVGFSWTVFFFNFFLPLFRGDWKWTIIMLVTAVLTSGLNCLVFMFIYNKLYVKELLSAGFKVRSMEAGSLDVVSTKLGVNLPKLAQANTN